MPMLVQLIGAVTAITGLSALVAPERFRGWIGWWRTGQRLRTGGLLKAIFGVVLFAGAAGSRWPTVLEGFGALTVIGGLAAAVGADRLDGWVRWWQSRPPSLFRLWGVAAIVIGLIVVAAVV